MINQYAMNANIFMENRSLMMCTNTDAKWMHRNAAWNTGATCGRGEKTIMAEYIDKTELSKAMYQESFEKDSDLQKWDSGCWIRYKLFEDVLASIPVANVVPVPDGGIGELSDGYHTFNGLYYQRMILFAALVDAYPGIAWKSWKHEDGELCFGGGWFIVGIDTPKGSYTYHYEEKYWNWFECEELPAAKHWDGHTEEDVTRLLSLPDVVPVVHGKWKQGYCSKCGYNWGNDVPIASVPNYCPDCGARMDGGT